jgi:hypothetical protein
MSDEEMVSVPKWLLAQVLDNAEDDSHAAQNEYSCSAEDDAEYQDDRGMIDKLREIAGLTRQPPHNPDPDSERGPDQPPAEG